MSLSDIEPILNLIERVLRLKNFDSYQLSARLNVNDSVTLDAIEAMEELAVAVSKLDVEYLSSENQCPIIDNRSSFPIGIVFAEFLDSDEWTHILASCLGDTTASVRSNLKVKLYALHLLLAVYEWNPYSQNVTVSIFPVENIIPLNILVSYVYCDAYNPDFQKTVLSTKAADTRNASGFSNKRKSTGSHDPLAATIASWERENPDGLRLLRVRATGILAFVVAELEKKSVEYLLDVHVEKAMPISLPNVLLYRLRHEIFAKFELEVAEKLKIKKWQMDKVEPTKATKWLHRLNPDRFKKDCCSFELESLSGQEARFIFRVISAITSISKRIVRSILLENGMSIFLDFLKYGNIIPALGFDTLEMLGQLVLHPKAGEDFIMKNGMLMLLEVAETSNCPTFTNAPVAWCFANISTTCVEKLCQLPCIERMVTCLMKLSQVQQNETSQVAICFFIQTLKCPVFLHAFDAMRGQSLFLRMLHSALAETDLPSSEEMIATILQALIHYYRVHLSLAVHAVRMSLAANEAIEPPGVTRARSGSVMSMMSEGSSASRIANRQIPQDQPRDVDDVSHQVDLNFLHRHRTSALEMLQNVDSRWAPLEPLLKFDAGDKTKRYLGLKYLFQVIHYTRMQDAPATRWLDAAASALRILRIVTLLSSSYKLVCELNVRSEGLNIDDDDLETIPGITVLLETAGNTKFSMTLSETQSIKNADLIAAALEVLCNCVSPSCGDDRAQRPVRRLACDNNALLALLSLLTYNETPKVADRIRHLALIALNGLANDSHIVQVLGSLNVIQVLTRISGSDPVLVGNKELHRKIQAEALKLIQTISGMQGDENMMLSDAAEETNRRLLKSTIVSKTCISFDPNELASMVHDYLRDRGYLKAAQALEEERQRETREASEGSRLFSWPTKYLGGVEDPSHAKLRRRFGFLPAHVAPQVALTPVKSAPSKNNKRSRNFICATPPSKRSSLTPSRSKSGTGNVSALEKLIQDYLREQHRKCLEPVTIVPPFSLSQPHRCATARTRRNQGEHSSNMATRVINRAITGNRGGIRGCAYDMHIIHGRARCSGVIKSIPSTELQPEENANNDEEDLFTSLCFYRHNNYEDLLLGTADGCVLLKNTKTQNTFSKWQVSESEITSVAVTPDGSRLVTCAQGIGILSMNRLPESLLSDSVVRRYRYDVNRRNETIDELSSCWTDISNVADVEIDHYGRSLVATSLSPEGDSPFHSASIIDLASGLLKLKLIDKTLSSCYDWHRACFAPGGDDVVLHDGLLWDVRGGKVIRKLDKLSSCGMATFRPDGTQVIVDAAIWDMRTYKLLLTYQPFESSVVRFDYSGSVVYSYTPRMMKEILSPANQTPKIFSSYSVTSAFDFSKITTVDTYRVICAMELSPDGNKLALVTDTVESVEDTQDISKRSCKIFDIGCVEDELIEREDSEWDDEETGFPEDDDDDDDEDDDDDDDDDDDEGFEDDDDDAGVRYYVDGFGFGPGVDGY